MELKSNKSPVSQLAARVGRGANKVAVPAVVSPSNKAK
jgi:hypothetical protein